MSTRRTIFFVAVLCAVTARTAPAQTPPVVPPLVAESGQNAAVRRAPKPYAQVITSRARTERGGITVHRVDDRYFFEVPDSLVGRDFLMVTRVAGVPAGAGGFRSAGSSLNERMIRWERVAERVLLKSISTEAVADDSLPIAKSVAQNNYAPILSAFPIVAFSSDSTSYVIDVTDFFSADNPATSGLSADQRRAYGARRDDPARSYISSVRGFPIKCRGATGTNV